MTTAREELTMLESHEHIIHSDIIPRLEELEKAQMSFTNQVSEIKTSQTNLELTVMKDGQETRGILNKFVDHYFASDRQRMDVEREVIQVEERITIHRLSTKEKIILGILGTFVGSGGLLAGIAGIVSLLK